MDGITLEFLKSLIGTAFRNLASPLVAYLIAGGWITEDDSTKLVSVVIVALAGLVWGVYQKWNIFQILANALQLPAGSTIESAKGAVKNG